ncbi:histidine phosphatase family protein [Luteibacter aegosomatis]|uniref:histidine phosphatase family protein n=1 Tax=Luteibacter aegosomatis TaxID=2911537 RepID=UPI001FFBDFF9|nr:histidine phosphatase family protein [Luteibacter aegosomatis]UPG87442.1 histidine phosphatase family protein [Luteibacter aegosomatis]
MISRAGTRSGRTRPMRRCHGFVGARRVMPDADFTPRSRSSAERWPPGGESWCDVILRLRSVVDGIRLTKPDCRVLVVGHQVIVNCFRYLLEHMREDEILAVDAQGDFPNCGYAEYDIERGPPVAFTLRHGRFLPPTLDTVDVTTESDVPGGPR